MWTANPFFTCSLRVSLLSVNSTTVGSAVRSVSWWEPDDCFNSRVVRACAVSSRQHVLFIPQRQCCDDVTSTTSTVLYMVGVVLTSRGLATDRHFLVRLTNTNEFETRNDGIHQRCPNVLIKNVATRKLSALRGVRFATVDLSFLLSYFSVYRVWS